jgi:uncharacterized repeat protein (TIGR03943 family)
MTVAGQHDRFVHPRMTIPLLVSALIVLVSVLFAGWRVLSVSWAPLRAALRRVRIVRSRRIGWNHPQRRRHMPAQARSGGGHDHDHHHPHRNPGWLLLVPVVVVLAIRPASLGASATTQLSRPPQTVLYGDLEPIGAGGEVSLPMLHRYATREPTALTERTVVLTGFVVNDLRRAPQGLLLHRFAIGCCAADAVAVLVGVRTGEDFADGTWLRVEASWVPPAQAYPERGDYLVEVTAERIEVIDEPANPYDSLW